MYWFADSWSGVEEEIDDVFEAINDEGGLLLTVGCLYLPAIEQHGVDAGRESSHHVGIQVVANHQRTFFLSS